MVRLWLASGNVPDGGCSVVRDDTRRLGVGREVNAIDHHDFVILVLKDLFVYEQFAPRRPRPYYPLTVLRHSETTGFIVIVATCFRSSTRHT